MDVPFGRSQRSGNCKDHLSKVHLSLEIEVFRNYSVPYCVIMLILIAHHRMILLIVLFNCFQNEFHRMG